MEKINIFCDASIDFNTKDACAGCLVLSPIDKHPLYQFVVKKKDATNNLGEILAILVGVKAAIFMKEMYNVTSFNIFSDSKLSVLALKQWIYQWMEDAKYNGILYTSNGTPVANQKYFRKIIKLVVDNDIHINYYHQMGHVSGSEASLTRANKMFIESNGFQINDFKCDGLNIKDISIYNNEIDYITRNALYTNKNIPYEPYDIDYSCITKEDMYKYKTLVGK